MGPWARVAFKPAMLATAAESRQSTSAACQRDSWSHTATPVCLQDERKAAILAKAAEKQAVLEQLAEQKAAEHARKTVHHRMEIKAKQDKVRARTMHSAEYFARQA